DLAHLINPLLKASKCKILMEPGRYLTGNAGCLVSKVLYTKSHREKNFLIIDAAMNDLLRPALYNAYHHILTIDYKVKEEINYDVVGPVCETGDFIALNRKLPKMKSNELIAIMSAGAYGSVMSSNYNSRRKSPEVIVDRNKYYVARERESFDDLIKNEKIYDELFK
ncbi:MAG: diaminopimelate decarboxylase, partial [Ignavibacteria bacterium]|nr:diaminopimelate decarboxylase [Ignavibacteria bacterium]